MTFYYERNNKVLHLKTDGPFDMKRNDSAMHFNNLGNWFCLTAQKDPEIEQSSAIWALNDRFAFLCWKDWYVIEKLATCIKESGELNAPLEVTDDICIYRKQFHHRQIFPDLNFNMEPPYFPITNLGQRSRYMLPTRAGNHQFDVAQIGLGSCSHFWENERSLKPLTWTILINSDLKEYKKALVVL